MGKRVLITGSEGFIGRNLLEGLRNEYEVLHPGKRELDLCDTDSVGAYLRGNKIDIVIHAANFGARDHQSAPPLEIMYRGLRMFYNLKKFSGLYDRMYYFGSGAEYDRMHYIPYMKEEYFGSYIPEDGYGFYKYILARESMRSDNIYDMVLFGIYGKYEQWRYRFISSNVCRVLKGMPMTLSKNMFFDYIYVDDLVKIMRYFLENVPRHHRYNVCRGEHIDLKTLGELIKTEIGGDRCELLIAAEGMKLEYSGDNSRLVGEIGDDFEFTSFRDGIHSLKEYYRSIIDEIDESLLP